MGDSARRVYTGNMLCKGFAPLPHSFHDTMPGIWLRNSHSHFVVEHFFQNTEIQRRSPNAYLYVQEYLNKRGTLIHQHRCVQRFNCTHILLLDRARHLVHNHDRLSSSSTSSVSRRSSYIRFVTEPDATSYSQARPTRPAANKDVSTVLSCIGSPTTSSPGFYRSPAITNSTEAGANTPTNIVLPEDEESELEEGEIRE
ncbi:hypothetical protein F5B21DRAFT_466794 [Xylaria acuta]|nr:hypothetical protein F5B21DRAFT_466794 [Xylaria acuta]